MHLQSSCAVYFWPFDWGYYSCSTCRLLRADRWSLILLWLQFHSIRKSPLISLSFGCTVTRVGNYPAHTRYKTHESTSQIEQVRTLQLYTFCCFCTGTMSFFQKSFQWYSRCAAKHTAIVGGAATATRYFIGDLGVQVDCRWTLRQ